MDFDQRLREKLGISEEPSGLPAFIGSAPPEVRVAGTGLTGIHAKYLPRPSGLLVPQAALAEPQPIDQIRAFLTFNDLFGWKEDLAEAAGLLSGTSRDDALSVVAWLIARAQALEGTKALQANREVAAALFKEPLRSRALHLIDRESRTLLAPQVLLVVARMILHVSPAQGPNPPDAAVAMASLVAADHIGDLRREEMKGHTLTVGADHPISPMERELAANQMFNHSPEFGSYLSRFARRWQGIPREEANDPTLRKDWIDLEAAFEEATGVVFRDFMIVSMTMRLAAASDRGPRVTRQHLEGLTIPAPRVDAALALLTCTPEEMKADLDSRHGEGVEFGFSAWNQRPILRLSSGDMLVMSPNFLLDRAFGWLPIYDIVEGLKAKPGTRSQREAAKKKARRAENYLRHTTERYAVETFEAMAVGRGDLARVYNEKPIQAAYGTGRPNADIAVEYPGAWVVAEISSRKIMRETAAAVSADALLKDLTVTIVEKAKQIHETALRLQEDESRLTGRPSARRRRYFPLLVTSEGFPVNPMTVTRVREMIARADLLTGPTVAPLRIVSIVDLEIAESVGENGGPDLVTLLDEHDRSAMRNTGFGDWLLMASSYKIGRPRRLDGWQDVLNQCMEAARDAA